MEEKHKLIWDFQRAIVEVYKEEGLTSLRGGNGEYVVNGKQIISWFYEVVRKGSCKYSNTFFQKNFDDLLTCSDEVMYFLGNMYLYKPFINNPIKDGFEMNEGNVYPNLPNIEVKRYNMFVNIVSEKLYNYWDRIGDLLAIYFPEEKKLHPIFFAKTIELIPKEYHDNENYV